MKAASFFFAIMLSGFLSAQDVLTLKSGEVYHVKVEEVTEQVIRFRMYGNAGGPLYSIGSERFRSLTYENGAQETLFAQMQQAPTIKVNGLNTSTSPFQAAAAGENIPAEAPVQPEKVRVRDVLGALLFTGILALNVAAEMSQQKCAGSHQHTAGCCAR